MAQDQENANTGEAGAFLAEPSAAAQDGLATGIDDLQSQAIDSSEVSRQLEDLTGVVLSSAEVSTRSAEVAANISEEMRNVMLRVDDMGRRNVLHSRVILVGLLSFLLIAVGTFLLFPPACNKTFANSMPCLWPWVSALLNSTPPSRPLATPPMAWVTPPKNSPAWKIGKSSWMASLKPRWKT